MNISYFVPMDSCDDKPKREDKGLISPSQLREGAKNKAQKIEQSKNKTGLVSNNQNRLLTDDGREIFNENK